MVSRTFPLQIKGDTIDDVRAQVQLLTNDLARVVDNDLTIRENLPFEILEVSFLRETPVTVKSLRKLRSVVGVHIINTNGTTVSSVKTRKNGDGSFTLTATIDTQKATLTLMLIGGE